jgi:hypothetical protein
MLCTLTATCPTELALFGGEGLNGRFLNDLWIFKLQYGHWLKVQTQNSIIARSLHIAGAFNGQLVIFGGMDSDKNCLAECAKLQGTPLEKAAYIELRHGPTVDENTTNGTPPAKRRERK